MADMLSWVAVPLVQDVSQLGQPLSICRGIIRMQGYGMPTSLWQGGILLKLF